MEWIFSRDVAALSVQLAAILLVAFMVEMRALGTRRALDQRGSKYLLYFPFGCLTIVVVVAMLVLNGRGDFVGAAAMWSWALTGAALFLLTVYIAMVARVGIAISSSDVGAERARAELVEKRLREPGWKWFLFPAS